MTKKAGHNGSTSKVVTKVRGKHEPPSPPERGDLVASADRQLTALTAALRAERERRGISRWDLERLTGLSEQTIKQLEQGWVHKPHWRTLLLYAEALGLKLTWTRDEEKGG